VEVSVLGIRFAARLIDALLMNGVGVLLGRAMGYGYDWLALTAAVVLGYFALGLALFGATVGKRVLRLEVRGPSGGRPTLAQAVQRESFVLLGAIPFVGVFLAVAAWAEIALATRAGRPGFHDRLAHTALSRG
jgi:uncharacterized RDD family membrane protein YckC